jgi:hypothetical protein
MQSVWPFFGRQSRYSAQTGSREMCVPNASVSKNKAKKRGTPMFPYVQKQKHAEAYMYLARGGYAGAGGGGGA